MPLTIKFEGPQGCGKTLVSDILRDHLRELGFKLVVQERHADDIEVLNAVETIASRAAADRAPEHIPITDDTFHVAKNSGDATFLHWMADRLVNVYGEHSCTDFVQTLRAFAHFFEEHGATMMQSEDLLIEYLRRQWEWSLRTFGPGFRTAGIIQHIGKELNEVEREPHNLMEWLDIVILALDGYWRHGGSPERALPILQFKQDKNFARGWPDWRERSEDQAIEHDRTGEKVSGTA